jgi:hypothetical protein
MTPFKATAVAQATPTIASAVRARSSSFGRPGSSAARIASGNRWRPCTRLIG